MSVRRILLVLLAPMTFEPALAQRADAAERVGYWRFDEGSGPTAADSSANGYDASLFAGAGWGSGKFDSALVLGPGSDYAETGAIPLIDTLSEFTVAFWINGPETQTAAGGLFSVLDKGHRSNEALPVYSGWTCQGQNASGGDLPFVIGTGATFASITALGVLDDTWHHVAYTVSFEPTLTLQAYVDGQLQDTAVSPHSSIQGNTAPLTMGIWSFNSAREFNGSIDELQIWDAKLTEEEIAGLLEPPPVPALPFAGLVLLASTMIAAGLARIAIRRGYGDGAPRIALR